LERALRNTEKYQVGTDLRAWLFTIMHNIFIIKACAPLQPRRMFRLTNAHWKNTSSLFREEKLELTL